MKNKKAIFLLVLVSGLLFEASGLISANTARPINMIPEGYKVTIIYDNYVFTDGAVADWGFSCQIETEDKLILFDTGTKPEILINNMKLLNISPASFDQIIISHNHGDHTGGLFTIQKDNNKAEVYLPFSTSDRYVKQVKEKGNEVKLHKEKTEIHKNIFLSGEMGSLIKEQCLILDTEKGLVVITGCAHPGIIKMLQQVKKDFKKEIYSVIGGFHLMDKSDSEMQEILNSMKSLGIQRLGATHCTGDSQIEFFRKAYDKNFINLGVGRELIF